MASNPKASYRPDIDGLRALAVLSVIFYHLRSAFLPGGFLGVDIFFVISGYLITQILWREIAAGEYKIGAFYQRRVRRIMPALLVLVMATMLVSTVVLLPVDLMGLARSALATLAFVGNGYFWRDSDYFSRTAAEKPLLHLWSLGVEEQFYILYPFLLWLCRSLARRWTLAALLTLMAASFLLDVLMVKVGGANPAFYLLPTRAWELAAGAAAALSPSPALRRPVSELLAAFSMVLIGVGLLAGQSLPMAGLPVATPVVVGAAVLAWRAGRRTWAAAVLRAPPMVFVGLMSYSLYLWHWPIIVFSQYWLVHDLTLVESIAALITMFVAAYISWRFVERPFRARAMRASRLFLWVGAGSSAVGLGAIGLILAHGFPQRLGAVPSRINAAVGAHFRCPVRDYVISGASRGCVMSLPSHDPRSADVAMIGNSHALMYTPLLGELLTKRGLRGVLLNANSCLPSASFNYSRSCARQADGYISAAAELKAKIIFIGLEWKAHDTLVGPGGRPFKGPVLEGELRGLSDTIERLEAAGKTVVVIGPIDEPGWDVPSVLSRSLAFGRPVSRPLTGNAAAFESTYDGVLRTLEARPDIILVRPDLAQCRAGRCDFVRQGESLFADESHIAQMALPLFRPQFSAALDEAIKRSHKD